MRKLLVFAVVVAVLFGGWKLWTGHALSAVDPQDETRQLIAVPSGSSASDIADLLEQKDVIRSSFAFRRLVSRSDAAAELKAGNYVLKKSMNAEEILEVLTKGGATEVVVTIPEGYTVKDIDALLAEKGLMSPGDLTECARTCDFSSFDFLPKTAGLAPRGGKLEGYLYPDTYFVVSEEFVPKFFLERLLGTFRSKVVNGLAEDIKASGKSLDDIVTMASLVEEETRTNAERPVVAGILWRRLEIGMSLGVDAAVRYIVDKPTATITAADLDIESPYNLRKKLGLPPGPIANPGMSSIKAALKPQNTSYLYYLHGSDGQIRYAETNDEHNVNRAKYLR